MTAGNATFDEGALDGLPPPVREMLRRVIEEAREAFGANLVSAVLFGSGAEGRLRETSDVNLVFVLRAFERAQVDAIRDVTRTAEAAIRLDTMFLLESEIPLAAEAFAGKFADIRRRHRVLAGSDPFAGLVVPRAAAIYRNRQILLNLVLRLRDAYVLRSLRAEQASRVVAESAAPLRACAADLAELNGAAAASPREALLRWVASIGDPALDGLVARLSEARETSLLPPAVAAETLFGLIGIAARLRAEFDALK